MAWLFPIIISSFPKTDQYSILIGCSSLLCAIWWQSSTLCCIRQSSRVGQARKKSNKPLTTQTDIRALFLCLLFIFFRCRFFDTRPFCSSWDFRRFGCVLFIRSFVGSFVRPVISRRVDQWPFISWENGEMRLRYVYTLKKELSPKKEGPCEIDSSKEAIRTICVR